jgi:hypothetical protein
MSFAQQQAATSPGGVRYAPAADGRFAMRGVRGWTAMLLMVFAAGCYSHTKEVVYKEGAGPAPCKHAVWVPSGPYGEPPGYWHC